MSTQILEALPTSRPKIKDNDRDSSITRFAVVLPILMALLLALVPVLGTEAKVPFLLVLVPLVIWSAFRDTERAIYVYIAWCWMDGTIRGVLGISPVTIVARDIVLGIVVVGWIAQRLQNRYQDPLRCPPGSLLVALFVINCLLQVFNPYSLGLVQSIGGLKLHLSPIPLFFVAYDVFRRRGQVRSLFVFLTLASLVIGLVSLVQYIGGQNWTWAHFPGTKEAISQSMHVTEVGNTVGEAGLFKPPGTTAFGGGTSAYVSVAFPLTFGLLMLPRKHKASHLLQLFLLGVLMAFVVIMLINGLRSSLVSGIAGVVVSGVLIGRHLRGRMLKGIAVCFVLGLVALTYSQGISQGGVTDRFSSTFANPVKALHQDRRTFFDDVAFITVHSPVGVGLGRMLAGSGRLGSSDHSLDFVVYSESYLGEIMYETGIIGGILISAIAVAFIRRGYLALARLYDANDRFLATAILGALIVLSANFFVTPVLMGPPGSVMFWLLGGLLLRVFAKPESTSPRVAREAV